MVGLAETCKQCWSLNTDFISSVVDLSKSFGLYAKRWFRTVIAGMMLVVSSQMQEVEMNYSCS